MDFRRTTTENKYLGFRFIYNRDLEDMTFYSREMYGHPTIEDCIYELRATFLYGDDHYHLNINSVNFWDMEDNTENQKLHSLLF